MRTGTSRAVPIMFRDSIEWRRWLEKNHDRSTEVWILAYKVHTGKRCLSYSDALDEALCYGWIDSRMRRIDDEKHMWRFAPRKKNSIWSRANRTRALRLMREGRMKASGLATISAAKKNGRWKEALAPSKPPRMPNALKQALICNEPAWRNFRALAPSYRTTYLYWIIAAKTEETKLKRIQEVVRRAELNKKPFV